ncbi:RHS repeat-associated core domain-containing protein [Geothrix sp. 21YS21S-4]|uniref:RHS repeat-associated core domain-containing protein n=1 Tax=Geothrix sp. 21YS21S-4 TaxID=3068889 RepID=UPI0027B915DF|nr:RHS repeat-associated core domain-containing protein [Geothrix sp. 21YS21S-4]
MRVRQGLAACLFLLVRALTAGEPGQGNTSIEPAHRWIPVGPAQVDAVTGEMKLNLPIGPTLPGRIPIGFVWHTEGLGTASFDAYQWPTWDSTQTGNRVIVTLGHEKVTFLRGAPLDTTATPAAVQKWYSDRGLSTGAERIGTLEEGYTPYFGATVFTSEDGTSHLVVSAWRVKAPVPPKPWTPETYFPPADNRVFGPRMAIIQGDTALWSSFEDDAGQNIQQKARPSMEIRNRWGDWVRLDNTFDATLGTLTGATLSSSLGHVLTFGGSGSSWSITNNMGLATIQMTSVDEVWRGQMLTSVSRADLSGNDWTLTWMLGNTRLSTLESRGGSKIEYQWTATSGFPGAGVPVPVYECFGPEGNWKGFEPVTYTSTGNVQIGEGNPGLSTATFSSTVPGETGGSFIEFLRTYPKPASYDTTNKTIAWTSTAYQTEIRIHPQPAAGTSYRFTRLIHAQPVGVFGAPDQAVSDQRQMALFALSTVVQELQGTMSGTTEVIRKKITHDGWTLKSPMNANGDVVGQVALSPVATRTIVERPAGEGPTETSEQLNWTGRIFGTQRRIIAPDGLTAYDGTGKPANAAWRAGALPEGDQASGGIVRSGAFSAVWNSDLVLLLKQSAGSNVGGTNYPALRGVASVDLGSKSYQNDSLGRATSITGVTGGYTATLEQTLDSDRPEVKSTTRRVTGPSGSSPSLSGRIGEDFAYTGLWRTGVRQRPDSRWATEERDTLGRVKAIVSPEGIRTTVLYDAYGRAWKTVREAKGAVAATATWKEWDPAGRWVREHAPGADGSDLVKETRLDAFGRTVAVTTAKGTAAERTVYSEYDGYGQKIRESLPTKAGSTPKYSETSYDLDGFVLQTKNTRGVVTAIFNRPQAGILDGQTGWLATTNLLRKVGTIETYVTQKTLKDDLGQVIRSLDGMTQLTQLAYDPYGRLKEVRRGGQVRSYTHNEMGWLLSQTQPEEGTTLFESHTAGGQALKVTKGSGTDATTVITDLYPVGDPNEGLAHIITTSGLGAATTTTLGYDGLRRLHSRIETQAYGNLTETYGYDDLSRLNSKTTSDGTVSFTVSRDFDAFGNVVREYYPTFNGQGGGAVTRGYDAFHRPSGVGYGPTYGESNVASMAYDQTINGEEGERLTYANAATTTWQRNGDQELSRVIQGAGGSTVEDAAVAWSNDGRMLSRGADAFEYDGLGRLSKAVIQGVNGERIQQLYGYDLYGNRASVESSALVGLLPAEAVTCGFTFGTDNRLPSTTLAGVNTGVHYDGQGRMKQVWAVPGDPSTLTSWAYDALGRVISQDGAVAYAESYLLSGEGLRFKRMKPDGSIQYTVYGFNREPLSVFEKTPAVVTTAQAKALAAAAKASSKMTTASLGTNPVITSPSGPVTVRVNQTVMFAGNSPDGDAGSWTFGDGATASGWATSHAYGAAGTYTATLTTRLPSQGRCLTWGWDDAGNRVCNNYQINWTNSSTTVTITVLPDAPVIQSFTASPTTIPSGSGSTLSWSVAGASTVTLAGSGVGASGGVAVYPASTASYTLFASNAGGTATATVTVTVVQPPIISSFWANPTAVYQGDPSTLNWSAGNATALSLDQGIGSVLGSSSRSVSPSGTTTYTLTAVNTLNGVSVTRTAAATVTVNPRPTVPTILSFTADASAIGAGQGTTLRWSVSNGVGDVSVTLSGGAVAQNGSQFVAPAATATYTLKATNTLDPTKFVTRDVTVTVVNRPVITFTASPTTINVGSGSTLAWTVGNDPTSVFIDQGVGNAGAAGSVNVLPGATTTYTLTASNLGGTATATVTVSVTQKPVIVSFQSVPSQINQGNNATLSWSMQGATSLTLNGMPVTGTSVLVSPSQTTTYTLVAANSAGTATASVTVTVVIPEAFVWRKNLIYGFGQLICEDRPTGRVYLQGDHLGTPSVLTNAGGTVIGRQKSLPFGERMLGSGEKGFRRFTSHEDGTQLPIYMQARMYLPTYGRFAQVDPAYDHSDDGLNLYSYVSNQPITRTDPDGMREGTGNSHTPLVLDAQYGQEGWITWFENPMSMSGGSTNPYSVWGGSLGASSYDVPAAQSAGNQGAETGPGRVEVSSVSTAELFDITNGNVLKSNVPVVGVAIEVTDWNPQINLSTMQNGLGVAGWGMTGLLYGTPGMTIAYSGSNLGRMYLGFFGNQYVKVARISSIAQNAGYGFSALSAGLSLVQVADGEVLPEKGAFDLTATGLATFAGPGGLIISGAKTFIESNWRNDGGWGQMFKDAGGFYGNNWFGNALTATGNYYNNYH